MNFRPFAHPSLYTGHGLPNDLFLSFSFFFLRLALFLTGTLYPCESQVTMGYLVAFVSALCVAFALGADEKVMKTSQVNPVDVEESQLKHLFTRIGAGGGNANSEGMMDLFESPFDLPGQSINEQKSSSQVDKANDLQTSPVVARRTSDIIWRRPSFLFAGPRMQEDSPLMEQQQEQQQQNHQRQVDTRYKNTVDKRMLGLFAHATLRSEQSNGLSNRKLTTRLSSPTTGAGGPLRIHGLMRSSMPRLRWG